MSKNFCRSKAKRQKNNIFTSCMMFVINNNINDLHWLVTFSIIFLCDISCNILPQHKNKTRSLIQWHVNLNQCFFSDFPETLICVVNCGPELFALIGGTGASRQGYLWSKVVKQLSLSTLMVLLTNAKPAKES